jgi:hypothetical protein
VSVQVYEGDGVNPADRNLLAKMLWRALVVRMRRRRLMRKIALELDRVRFMDYDHPRIWEFAKRYACAPQLPRVEGRLSKETLRHLETYDHLGVLADEINTLTNHIGAHADAMMDRQIGHRMRKIIRHVQELTAVLLRS